MYVASPLGGIMCWARSVEQSRSHKGQRWIGLGRLACHRAVDAGLRLGALVAGSAALSEA